MNRCIVLTKRVLEKDGTYSSYIVAYAECHRKCNLCSKRFICATTYGYIFVYSSDEYNELVGAKAPGAVL